MYRNISWWHTKSQLYRIQVKIDDSRHYHQMTWQSMVDKPGWKDRILYLVLKVDSAFAVQCWSNEFQSYQEGTSIKKCPSMREWKNRELWKDVARLPLMKSFVYQEAELESSVTFTNLRYFDWSCWLAWTAEYLQYRLILVFSVKLI